MKIIQVIPVLGFGGAETMCENLTYELLKMGHKVVVVSLYDQATEITKRMETNGVDIRYMHKKPGLDLSLFGRLKRLFIDENPDVVHTHLYAAKYAFVAAKSAKVSHIVHTLHNIALQESSKLSRIFNGLFFRRGIVTPVALSKLVQDTVVNEYKIEANNIPIIYNGVDLSKCDSKDNYAVEGKFKILHIGRFSKQKNHIGLVNAFKVFVNSHSDAELWLIGDGEERSEIESFVDENDLRKSIIFFGLQENVYKYLKKADIFTLPSNYEGVPMTLIEAMGTGLPIVATAVGGVPDMLTDNSAQLIPVEEEALINAFEKYYDSFELREKHGINAKMCSVEFSSEIMAKKYCEVYVSLER